MTAARIEERSKPKSEVAVAMAEVQIDRFFVALEAGWATRDAHTKRKPEAGKH